jgi:hypothetical protein
MPVPGTGAPEGPQHGEGGAVTASPSAFRDLARRAREANGPDQALADAVARAIGWVEEGELWWDAQRSVSVYVLPGWTAELEAVAQWVVPAGWQWRLGPGGAAHVWRPLPPEAEVHDQARTPALSLLAAALEARALEAETETPA